MQLINISRIVLLVLLPLMMSCSHDDDNDIEDPELLLTWNYGYTYSYEYEGVSLIGGELKASFRVDACFKFNQLPEATINGSGMECSNTNDYPCERGTECDWLHAEIWTG